MLATAARLVAVGVFGKPVDAFVRVLLGFGVFQVVSGGVLLLTGGVTLARVCASAAITIAALGVIEVLLRATAGARVRSKS